MLTGKLHKKEKQKRLKYFPAGYVGNSYRNLADNVDTFLGSDFYGRISNDSDLPTEDIQKYIRATSDFAKGIQTDINHYVTKVRINDASFRQKLDPTSKNIIRRQNLLELLFEDVSTFDAESPIVGSLLREIDLNKKQTDSDFIKSLPSQPGKEFEIKKCLDRLRDIKKPSRKSNNNNKNNNSNAGGNLFPGPGDDGNLFPPGPGPRSNLGFSPPPPTINEFIQPNKYKLQNRFNSLRGTSSPPHFFANNASNFHIPAQTSRFNRSSRSNPPPPANNFFGMQTATMSREKLKDSNLITETKIDIDDTLYKLPENSELELGDGLIENLGVTAEDLLDTKNITKKEEEDAALEQIKEKYGFQDIKDAFDDGYVPDNVYFFYQEVGWGGLRKVKILLELLNI